MSQEEIPSFMRVAEALKVKGLTESKVGETNGSMDGGNSFKKLPPVVAQSTPKIVPVITGVSMKKKQPPPMKRLLKPVNSNNKAKTKPLAKILPKPPSPKIARVDESVPRPIIEENGVKMEPFDPEEFGSDHFEDQPLDISSMLDMKVAESGDDSSILASINEDNSFPMDVSSPGEFHLLLRSCILFVVSWMFY